jgi:tRNA(adenine34) deaminase
MLLSGNGFSPMSSETTGSHSREHMLAALEAAREAGVLGEVPVGAAIVVGDEIIAVAGNRTVTDCDPAGHAEIIALRLAARAVGNYRLTDAVVFSTIEPCAMCAGALVQARVKRLVYGAPDPRFGAVESQFRICDSALLNHRMEIVSGVLEEECRRLVQDFFRVRRKKADSEELSGSEVGPVSEI